MPARSIASATATPRTQRGTVRQLRPSRPPRLRCRSDKPRLRERGLRRSAAALVLSRGSSATQRRPIAERLAPCLACHGENGTSSTPDVPSLGAQPAYFLLIQLFMFRERLRPIEPMTQMLKGVSDDDLRAHGGRASPSCRRRSRTQARPIPRA